MFSGGSIFARRLFQQWQGDQRVEFAHRQNTEETAGIVLVFILEKFVFNQLWCMDH